MARHDATTRDMTRPFDGQMFINILVATQPGICDKMQDRSNTEKVQQIWDDIEMKTPTKISVVVHRQILGGLISGVVSVVRGSSLERDRDDRRTGTGGATRVRRRLQSLRGLYNVVSRSALGQRTSSPVVIGCGSKRV